jgi:hypothetical protein
MRRLMDGSTALTGAKGNHDTKAFEGEEILERAGARE